MNSGRPGRSISEKLVFDYYYGKEAEQMRNKIIVSGAMEETSEKETSN